MTADVNAADAFVQGAKEIVLDKLRVNHSAYVKRKRAHFAKQNELRIHALLFDQEGCADIPDVHSLADRYFREG